MSAMRLVEGGVRPAEFSIGDVIDDRYELRRDLGRGAGGIVFEARHQFTGRSVALKLVAPDVPRAMVGELRARLLREAHALAAVRHPGIVEVLDGGVTQDGTPYLVMEQLEGRTLEGLLATRGKLTQEDAVATVLQLCDALDVAHRAGVVHRDVKPSNVLVVRDTEGHERLKLVDFGIAQVRGREEKLTGIGALIGTPAYMSPEQLLALDDVDHLADIYSLGVTLFECLSGRVPYEGTYQRVLLRACSSDPAPSLSDVLPDADEVLVRVVARAIAKKREDRFATVMELARAIHDAYPDARTQTHFLGAPPLPRFARPAAKPAPNAAEQRRRTPRAAYVTPARLLLEGGFIDGRTEDISEGGVLVICRQPCAPGSQVVVRFALPIEGRVVACQAHVRWVRDARPGDAEGPRAIGLEFTETPAEVKASIARYCALMGT